MQPMFKELLSMWKYYAILCHMSTHMGERPHKCDLCDEDCTHKNNLIKHMMIRTGENYIHVAIVIWHSQILNHLKYTWINILETNHIYVTKSTRFFKQNCNLLDHLMIHNGETPYQCTHCDKVFNQNWDLKNI